MRKFLLAGAAILAAGAAQAQTTLNTSPAAPGTTGPFANAQPAPAPGQVAVRLNGAFRWYFAVAANGDAHHDGEKLTTTGMKSYIRLYPGFDGVAANGLRYGVAAEIRQDNEAGTSATPGSIATNGPRGRMYWRRADAYIGGDSWGQVRFGSNDGPITSMGGIGHFYNVGTGNWCGDAPVFNHTGAGGWAFLSCSGQIYGTNKLQYRSPQWNGFDFGLAWEPGTGGLQASNECATTGAGCDMLSTTTSTDYRRRRNTMDVAVRYRGTHGGVGIAAVGGYMGGGHVRDTTNTQAAVDGMSVGYGGMTLSYAGFTIGGALQGGENNGTSLKNSRARDQFSWVVGATYTTGPVQFGVTYHETRRQGTWAVTDSSSVSRTRRDRAFEAAINYGIAPGLSATIEYLWGDSHHRNKDIITQRSGLQDTVTTQMLVSGISLRW